MVFGDTVAVALMAAKRLSKEDHATNHPAEGSGRASFSRAWIVSSSWLKESFREGYFFDGPKYILEDVDYSLKCKSALKDAVTKARTKPHFLLKGYSVCLAKHVHPPVDILSIIVKSAGKDVIHRMGSVREPSKTIFIACEEDTEEAMLAAKRGICTYSHRLLLSADLDHRGQIHHEEDY